MQTIPSLSKGDTVLIISPAKSIDKKYVDAARALFEQWGLNVKVGPNALNAHNYFAGTDKERLKDLQWALDHPTAKAIICARGGYGTIRVINDADFTLFAKHPKWVVGFSDITILHNKLHDLGYPSIHGTVPLQIESLSPESETLSTLFKALFGHDISINANSHERNRTGNVESEIIGGNLAILESLIGTTLDVDYSGKVLFLEEISEYAYKLDRMLWALKLAGKFKELQGLIIGGLTDIKECQETFGCTQEELVKTFVNEYKYPVAFNIPSGHQKDNRSIIFGKVYSLNVSMNGTELTLKNGSSQ